MRFQRLGQWLADELEILYARNPANYFPHPIQGHAMKSRLQVLDLSRLLAALAVVTFHYTFNGINNGKVESIQPLEIDHITRYGYLGVELFFLISGYVITLSTENRTAAQFITQRAKRLYPAYWFGVIFTTIFSICLAKHPDMKVTCLNS